MRFHARGFEMKTYYGYNFSQTFNLDTLRLTFDFSSYFWKIDCTSTNIDVTLALLNTVPEELLYMSPPPGMNLPD